MSEMLSVEEIRRMLPHRYPFLLVDKIVEKEAGRVVALKNVTINEPFFQGHYPETPVMPGVLIVEAMAQAGGLAVGGTAEAQAADDLLPLLVALQKVRFRQVVRPGDQLLITATVTAARGNLVKIAARAKVGETVVAEGELSFMLAKKGEA